ncbi:MAG: hypothetical protein AAF958_00770 [Planctomycetota bacterium]
MTAALANYFVPRGDVIIGTSNQKPYHRHVRASHLRAWIPDWHSIKKLAWSRPRDEVVESDFRLHIANQHRIGKGILDPRFEATVAKSIGETLQEFDQRRWKPWIGDRQPFEFWTDDHEFERFKFHDFDAEWARFCEFIEIEALALPHLSTGNRRP